MSRKVRSTLSLPKELERRLLSYGAVVAAGLITSASPSQAAIVHTISSAPLLEGNNILPLDLDNDGSEDFLFAVSNCGSCTSLGIFSFGAYNAIMARYLGSAYYPDAFALEAGDGIGAAGPWDPFGANLGSGYGEYSYTDSYGSTTVYPGLLVGDFINRDAPGFLGLQFDRIGLNALWVGSRPCLHQYQRPDCADARHATHRLRLRGHCRSVHCRRRDRKRS